MKFCHDPWFWNLPNHLRIWLRLYHPWLLNHLPRLRLRIRLLHRCLILFSPRVLLLTIHLFSQVFLLNYLTLNFRFNLRDAVSSHTIRLNILHILLWFWNLLVKFPYRFCLFPLFCLCHFSLCLCHIFSQLSFLFTLKTYQMPWNFSNLF